MMHCNGKCQLMKKIQEQEKKHQGEMPEMKFASKVEVLSSKSWFYLNLHLSFIADKIHFFIADSGSPIDRSSAVFHPPPVVC